MTGKIALGVTLVVLGVLTNGEALAHGSEKHGGARQADAQMQKLHDMMPVFSAASAELKSALEKEDAASAKAAGGRILAAIPDLKKSVPHRNAKQHKKFVELAKKQEKTVSMTLELAGKGDYVQARTAMKKVEKTCAECHNLFR